MTGLPGDFIDALMLLARAAAAFRSQTGRIVVLVGGAAVAILTQGAFMSGDFDVVADIAFEDTLIAAGFRRENAPEHRSGGYFHPLVSRYGFQIVSGRLFDGLSDTTRLLPIVWPDGAEIILPPVEDLIADRLGQYAASGNRAAEMLEQARLLYLLATECDRTYLRRRIIDDTGDPTLLDLGDA